MSRGFAGSADARAPGRSLRMFAGNPEGIKFPRTLVGRPEGNAPRISDGRADGMRPPRRSVGSDGASVGITLDGRRLPRRSVGKLEGINPPKEFVGRPEGRASRRFEGSADGINPPRMSVGRPARAEGIKFSSGFERPDGNNPPTLSSGEPLDPGGGSKSSRMPVGRLDGMRPPNGLVGSPDGRASRMFDGSAEGISPPRGSVRADGNAAISVGRPEGTKLSKSSRIPVGRLDGIRPPRPFVGNPDGNASRMFDGNADGIRPPSASVKSDGRAAMSVGKPDGSKSSNIPVGKLETIKPPKGFVGSPEGKASKRLDGNADGMMPPSASVRAEGSAAIFVGNPDGNRSSKSSRIPVGRLDGRSPPRKFVGKPDGNAFRIFEGSAEGMIPPSGSVRSEGKAAVSVGNPDGSRSPRMPVGRLEGIRPPSRLVGSPEGKMSSTFDGSADGIMPPSESVKPVGSASAMFVGRPEGRRSSRRPVGRLDGIKPPNEFVGSPDGSAFRILSGRAEGRMPPRGSVRALGNAPSAFERPLGLGFVIGSSAFGGRPFSKLLSVSGDRVLRRFLNPSLISLA